MHSLRQNHKYNIENKVFFIFVGFQNGSKNMFHDFRNFFGNLALEKFWNMLGVVCTNPGCVNS